MNSCFLGYIQSKYDNKINISSRLPGNIVKENTSDAPGIAPSLSLKQSISLVLTSFLEEKVKRKSSYSSLAFPSGQGLKDFLS